MPRYLQRFVTSVLICVTGTIPIAHRQSGVKDGEWHTYGGDLGHTRYAAPDQINTRISTSCGCWRFKTDSLGPRPEYQYEGAPPMVEGKLFVTAGSRRAMLCLDAATGEMLWMHSENEGVRGDGKNDERILYVTATTG